MDRAAIYDFIASRPLAVLASLSPNGTPQSALIGIAVSPELEIVFDTVDTSRKYRNLRLNTSVSLVIGWDHEITLQYEGVAHQPIGAELQHYQEIYFAKWPDGPARLLWPGISYFIVRPRWIRYSDYNEGSRGIVEVNF